MVICSLNGVMSVMACCQFGWCNRSYTIFEEEAAQEAKIAEEAVNANKKEAKKSDKKAKKETK